MKVRKMEGVKPDDIKTLDEAFSKVEPETIGCCNWPEEYPYSPEVTLRMFHTGSSLLLRYDVAEKYTAARVTEDGGEVWTDSCVECFMAPDDSGYYNLEATCIGRILLSNRKSRSEGIVQADEEVLKSIVRIPSLSCEPFEECTGDNRWSLTLAIPPQALFRHEINDWSGMKLRMNFYKCGDNLSKPHFLSWKPVKTGSPDFHRPEFFAEVEFE